MRNSYVEFGPAEYLAIHEPALACCGANGSTTEREQVLSITVYCRQFLKARLRLIARICIFRQPALRLRAAA